MSTSAGRKSTQRLDAPVAGSKLDGSTTRVLNHHRRIGGFRLGRAEFTPECPGALGHQGDPGLITQHDNTSVRLVFVAPSAAHHACVLNRARGSRPEHGVRVHLLAADAQNPSGTCASTLWDTGHLAGQNIRPSETARYDITTVSVRNPQDFFARRS